MDSIIKVLTSQPSLTDDQNLILLDALQKAVNDNQTPTNMDNIKHLIKLQYKLRNISDLVSTAVRMIQLFPENIYPLEWVCKVVLQKSSIRRFVITEKAPTNVKLGPRRNYHKGRAVNCFRFE